MRKQEQSNSIEPGPNGCITSLLIWRCEEGRKVGESQVEEWLNASQTQIMSEELNKPKRMDNKATEACRCQETRQFKGDRSEKRQMKQKKKGRGMRNEETMKGETKRRHNGIRGGQ